MNISSVYNKMPALGKLGQGVKGAAETWKQGYKSMNETEQMGFHASIAAMSTAALGGAGTLKKR